MNDVVIATLRGLAFIVAITALSVGFVKWLFLCFEAIAADALSLRRMVLLSIPAVVVIVVCAYFIGLPHEAGATPSPAPVSGVTLPEQGSAPQPMPAVIVVNDAMARDSGNTGSPVAADPSMPARQIGTPLIGGTASWVRASLGARYLAMRLPRGTRVTVCGPRGCVDRAVTDYGPAARTHRVADLSRRDFARICGDPGRGLCQVSIDLLSVPLPPTDTDP